jgi:hypothetical protein
MKEVIPIEYQRLIRWFQMVGIGYSSDYFIQQILNWQYVYLFVFLISLFNDAVTIETI